MHGLLACYAAASERVFATFATGGVVRRPSCACITRVGRPALPHNHIVRFAVTACVDHLSGRSWRSREERAEPGAVARRRERQPSHDERRSQPRVCICLPTDQLISERREATRSRALMHPECHCISASVSSSSPASCLHTVPGGVDVVSLAHRDCLLWGTCAIFRPHTSAHG